MQTIETILQVLTIIFVFINYINIRMLENKLDLAERKLTIYEELVKNETN